MVLTKLERDSLKEVENMGIGNAATAMSKLIGKKVKIIVPKLEIIKITEIHRKVQKPRRLVVVCCTPIFGDLQGSMIILCHREEALKIANLLQKRKRKSNILTEKDQEALKKLGKALTGSFLTALSSFLKMSLEQSDPRLVYTSGESVMDIILMDIRGRKHALLLRTGFNIPEIKVKGEFITILTSKSEEQLWEKLKKKIKRK